MLRTRQKLEYLWCVLVPPTACVSIFVPCFRKKLAILKMYPFKLITLAGSLMPVLKWTLLSSTQLTFWFQDEWSMDCLFHFIFTLKQNMESQGIKSQRDIIKSFFFFPWTNNCCFWTLFYHFSPALFGLLLLLFSFLSVSMPFFTVVLGSARNKWYPQI